ncbi:MAG TPA: DUF2723 domain-containing protein, partial [Ardenticatenaceae bacterium]|nr:DUF2723 domain-containing protein [Ardenticatenaceae bacterium]
MSWRDHIFALALAAVAFLLYIATLAPSVATIFDDSLEFPLVAHRLAIAHPTGYPLYTLIIAMAARLLPVGDVAYRVNLVSALAGAGAVGVLYLAARQLGLGRAAATWSALVFATAETVWSQSVIAEVYALHLLLLAALIWTTLRWGRESGGAAERGSVERRAQLPLLPAFLFGLGLAHHRITLLWAPALAVYVWLRAPSLRRPGRAWLVLALAAAAPLLFYLYLPLRGHAGSLDGTYSNTLPDFLCWVTACQYQSFLTENPLGQSRDAAFSLDLLLRQLGPLNLVLLLVGILRQRLQPKGLFLLAGGALSAAFALAYRVADPEVFWLPVVLTGALWTGAGLQALLDFGQRPTVDRRPPTAGGTTEDGGRRTEDGRSRPYALRSTLYVLRFTFYAFLVLLLAASLPGWLSTARAVDRSVDWAVHDLGKDILGQALPGDATIIGILG